MNLANKLHQDLGITIVLITHNIKDALVYGNRLIQLQEGRIAHDLNTKDKTGLLIQELYQWFE
jgi:putative ABC transport system ATP-binding protein